MYKKRYLPADAAAAFPYIWFHFQLHLFSTSAARESGSGHLMGGSLRQGAKINYRRFNPYALSIRHSPNNEPNAEWLHMQRKGEGGKRRKTRLSIEEIHLGQPAAYQVITHLSLLQRETWNGRGNSCPSPRIQSAEYTAGELMDVSTGRAIW